MAFKNNPASCLLAIDAPKVNSTLYKVEPGQTECPVSNIYLNKVSHTGAAPRRIRVTVEVVED